MYEIKEKIIAYLLRSNIEVNDKNINALLSVNNKLFKGIFNIYEIPTSENIENRLINKTIDNNTIKLLENLAINKTTFENQIIADGLLLWLAEGINSVGNLVCGNGASPLIPSTDMFIQPTIQSPINNIVFPKITLPYQAKNPPAGISVLYTFVRPATSFGGQTINELGIKVYRKDLSNALICRVCEGTGTGTVSWLPYTFSNTADTVMTWGIELNA